MKLNLFQKVKKTALHILTIVILSFAVVSCVKNNKNKIFNYGTENDEARYYFQKGWQEIMDYGRWTKSETAFRKASTLDPNWDLGKSMVARITQNLQERQQILKELQETKHLVGDDERLLLDVNILSHIAANNRDLGKSNPTDFNQKRWALAEKNFGAFARKYPEDNYFKAEYIELLHLSHGAQTALDSLRILVTSEQRKLGFYLGYEASLELELGNIDTAIALSKELDDKLTDSSFNSPLILKAKIYKTQDSIEKAKQLVDQVTVKDPKHLIAIGMQIQLEKLLKSND